MPLQIIQNDLTRIACDAVVNPTDEILSGSGGTDAALHLAAGPELAAACERIGVCAPGEAVLTPGFALPARHVIHTVGPRWTGGQYGERETLSACYRSCLAIAEREGFQSIAFPIIAAGTFGFPKDEALEIAVREIRAFLDEHDADVTLVVFNPECYEISRTRYEAICAFLEDRFDEPKQLSEMPPGAFASYSDEHAPRPKAAKMRRPVQLPSFSNMRPGLDRELDESFSEMLLRKIDERGMKDSECYKRANIDRKLFSKIRSNPQYRASKSTVLAFAVALELDLNETRELLRKAGYALSQSYRFDVIVEYFIREGIYDIYEINEALFAFDQPLLGAG